MEKCTMCPRFCNMDRTLNKGICLAGNAPVIAKVMLHRWEEPFISGDTGSGALFFAGCNLRCVYCQNIDISQTLKGQTMTDEAILRYMFRLKELGAVNINFVTAAHFTDRLIPILVEAKHRGLDLPMVWNSSAYESVATLKKLDGLIDIYLPDFKYLDPWLARHYSGAADYPEIAKDALAEMYRQTGPLLFEDDLLKRGMVVRHLILPGQTEDSQAILAYLYKTYQDNIYLSIMNQYTPAGDLEKYPELNRRLTEAEYEEVVDYALALGITKALVQSPESQSLEFTPDFDILFEETGL